MVGTLLRDTGRRATLIAAAIVGAMALIAAYVSTALSGTKTGAVLALASTAGPLLLVAAIVAPMIFPFSLYVFLTPFDSMLVLANNNGAASTVTLLIGAMSAATLLFYMLRTKRFTDPPRELAVWLLYYLWIVASIFWAIDTDNTFKLLPTVLSLFALYVVVSMMRIDARTLRIVSAAIVAGATTASAYMLYLYRTGMALKQERLWLQNDAVNVNPDHYAASLLLPLAVATIALLYTKSLLVRIACFISIGIMLPVLVLSGARGPQLGLLVLLGYLIIRDRHRWKIAAAFTALLGLAILHAGPENFLSRWTQAASDGGAGRTDIWKVGWLAFKENWLFGAGFNNFPIAYNQAFIHVFQPLYEGWNRAPHSVPLQAGVELGVIGLSLLLLGWWVQFRLLRHVPATDPRYPLRTAFEASVLGLFVCGLFALQMETKYLWLAFTLGVLIRNTRLPDTQPLARTPEHA